MKPPIHNTFAPLANSKQVRLAFLLQCMPGRLKHGPEREELRTQLEQHFHKHCTLLSSGREALLAGLKAANIGPGDEVILQAYTCTVVSNAIIAVGALPIYCDISTETLNLDPEIVRSNINQNTKAIICQHTFGIPADTAELQKICAAYNIVLIEDCAHSIPTSLEQKSIGFNGDIIVLSFGRDKAVSGVSGGAMLTSNPAFAKTAQQLEEHAVDLGYWHIAMLIAYPVRYQIAKWLWRIGLGLFYLKLLQWSRALPAIYTPKEREGIMGKVVHRVPNACAALALQQWQQLGVFNAHRRRLSALYEELLSTNAVTKITGITLATAPQKYPILLHHRDAVLSSLRKRNIHLQDGWCGQVINPPSTKQQSVFYRAGSAKIAEYVAANIMNLPTHPTMSVSEAERLVRELKLAIRSVPYPTSGSKGTL